MLHARMLPPHTVASARKIDAAASASWRALASAYGRERRKEGEEGVKQCCVR
jgi:hypothetical protein